MKIWHLSHICCIYKSSSFLLPTTDEDARKKAFAEAYQDAVKLKVDYDVLVLQAAAGKYAERSLKTVAPDYEKALHRLHLIKGNINFSPSFCWSNLVCNLMLNFCLTALGLQPISVKQCRVLRSWDMAHKPPHSKMLLISTTAMLISLLVFSFGVLIFWRFAQSKLDSFWSTWLMRISFQRSACTGSWVSSLAAHTLDD